MANLPILPNIPILVIAQYKHDPKVKAVRVNGQITEVKQLKIKANSKMGDHLGSIHFVLFSLAMIGRNVTLICLI